MPKSKSKRDMKGKTKVSKRQGLNSEERKRGMARLTIIFGIILLAVGAMVKFVAFS